MSGDDLPPGWISGYSNTHKKTYYYHVASKKSIWVKPTSNEYPQTPQELPNSGVNCDTSSLAESVKMTAPAPRAKASEGGTKATIATLGDVSKNIKKKQSPAVSSNSFLGNLLGNMSKLPKVVPTVKSLKKDEKQEQLEEEEAQKERLRFRKDVDRKMSVLLEDPDRTEHHFEPCDSLLRYIIHDAAQGFDGALVTVTEGDGEDRHTVVYKKGHEPDESAAEEELARSAMMPAFRKRPRQRAAPERPPGGDGGATASLVVLNTKKRDLRSIEQIQLDMKASKRTKGVDSEAAGSS